MIGAAAMAVHGVARSTADLDLLAVDRRCLDAETWQPLRASGITVDLRAGSVDDPLAGVVRFSAPRERPVDLVVGRSTWQAAILDRARVNAVAGVRVPVATASDLIVLKLYAGGPQDAWDVTQLLGGPDGPALARDVDEVIGRLSPEAGDLWSRIRNAGFGSGT